MQTNSKTRLRWNPLSRALLLCGLITLAAGTVTEAQAQIDLGTFSAGEVWSQLGGTFTYALDPTTPLPPGLALRFDTPPFFPSNVHAGIIGIATVPRSTPYTFNLLRDGLQVAYQIKITALAVRDPWQTPDAFVNVPFSYQVSALNAQGPVTWTPNGPVPDGLTVSSSGLISGSPTTSGSYYIDLRLTDGVDTVYRGVNVNIHDVRITTPGMLTPNAIQGLAYNTTIEAAGGAGGFTFSSSNLPFGLTLSESGVLSGTVNGTGKFSFDITATDVNHVSYSKRMALTVAGLPRTLPRINPYDNNFLTDCSFFVNCTRGIGVVSGGVAPFTWSATGLPPGMSVRFGDGVTQWWITPGDAELSGTPTQMGTFDVDLTVTDAEGATATNRYQLSVRPLYLWNSMPGGTYQVPYDHRFMLIGGQASTYAVSLAAGRLPFDLTLNPGPFTVTGTAGDGQFPGHAALHRRRDQSTESQSVPVHRERDVDAADQSQRRPQHNHRRFLQQSAQCLLRAVAALVDRQRHPAAGLDADTGRPDHRRHPGRNHRPLQLRRPCRGRVEREQLRRPQFHRRRDADGVADQLHAAVRQRRCRL
jgi:hypothetical protein